MPTTDLIVANELEKGRKQLLDLTTRNRLLSMPQQERARLIRVHDELSDEVVRLLVRESRPFAFKGKANSEEQKGPSDLVDEILKDVDADLDSDERGVAARHRDTVLQTTLTVDALQKRLLSFYLDAKTAIEEQGVNTLFLALGQLKWKDDKSSDIERYAPLLLVPVELRRSKASDLFRLRSLDQEPSDNLSLSAKIYEFGIKTPDFEWNEDFVPSEYFAEFAQTIGSKEGWEVLPNRIALGFFSFAKFLMYRDLNPETWPEAEKLDQHELISALVGTGFPASNSRFPDDANLDELVSVERLNHVMDSDSSQALAIEEVRAGENLVIQGPPGTGKSQTITNLISTAVLDGKRVLFVAEKLAALEVVQRRLENIGLGPLVLELHSHKANKRAVLDELKKTFSLGSPRAPSHQQLLSRLSHLREKLNSHAVRLNEPLTPSELTPITVIGHLSLMFGKVETRDLPVLESPESWTPDQRIERERLIDDIVSRIKEIGNPSTHSWKGVELTVLTKFDREEIEIALKSLGQSCKTLEEQGARLASILDYPNPSTFVELMRLHSYACCVGVAPEIDRTTITYSRWRDDFSTLEEIIRTGREFSSLRSDFNERFAESAWTIEMSKVRQHIAAHGKSLLRLLNSDYRKAMADFRGVIKETKPPRKLATRLKWLDDLILAKKHESVLTGFDSKGSQIFGFQWKALNSDWDTLEAIVAWVKSVFEKKLGLGLLNAFSKIQDRKACEVAGADSQESMTVVLKELEEVLGKLKYSVRVGFGEESIDSINLSSLQNRLQQWTSNIEELSNWVLFQHRVEQANEMGVGSVCTKILQGLIDGEKARLAFDLSYYRSLYRWIIEIYPILASFDGHSQNRLVNEFRQLDEDRIKLARYETLKLHHERMPRDGGIGAVGLLKGEMNKKRGHMAIRQLLKKTGSAAQAIKPVFMMSPLSVAQFLEPGGVRFDLVVFDEASQVDPLDAMGAIARGNQVVVVGDDRQLPPTKFFARLAAEDEEEDDDEDNEEVASAKDQESILGLATTKGIRSKMLRWHYRSCDPSLIQVSNYEFYGNNLFIIPSPHSGDTNMGLKFRHVINGTFDRGKTYQNVREAREVALAVIKHAIEHPEKSLGVAAFSVKQRDAIIDELELLRKSHSEAERFFDQHPFEPFFVKNLENVQGDERDVIFISVGYAKDASGFFAMNFGPLNRDGGERRLNVLISRAKERCEVFSSIQSEDIDLKRTSARGVVALKTYLKFAETGILGLPEPETDRGVDSPFEESVKRSLESEGYVVHPQVGSSGFFVDLAIINPDRPGQYVLGIECDGATYHSARSARERDRQRQAVLEDHGWKIHRIWSTDWFQNPQQQLAKTKQAIETARSTSGAAHEDLKTVEDPSEITRGDHIEIEELQTLAGSPYIETQLDVSTTLDIHEVSRSSLAAIVKKVVGCEAPIYSEEIVVRIRDAWGVGRAGRRIHDAVILALDSLVQRKEVTERHGFVWTDEAKVIVRDRSSVSSPTLRKPDRIAPEEYELAIRRILEANHGAAAAEIPVGVARLFGFKSTSRGLRSNVDSHVKNMLRKQEIIDDGQFLIMSEASSSPLT